MRNDTEIPPFTQLRPDKLQPVMAYIHGGDFKKGSGDERMYGFDYLLQRDVVCVSFNYRLGVFGFLSLNSSDVGVAGNAGLKDQQLALQWIRRNAQYFGGDPRNVTIFGDSAGAMSVQMHMFSESSRGLFDRAIVQSGTTLYPLFKSR